MILTLDLIHHVYVPIIVIITCVLNYFRTMNKLWSNYIVVFFLSFSVIRFRNDLELRQLEKVNQPKIVYIGYRSYEKRKINVTSLMDAPCLH